MKKFTAYALTSAAFAFLFGVTIATAQVVNPSSNSQGKATSAAPSYVNNTYNPLSLDLSGNLRMNCVSGCSGGTFNNSGSAVAPSSTNGQAAAWLYAFDASNWQYVGIDASHNLTVKVNVALPAGSAIIGKVGIDQTTPGTTNGVQINAALPAGTNLIGSTTSVGDVAAGSADSGNPVKIGGVYNTTPPTLTNGQRGNVQLDAAGNMRHVIMDAAGNARGANVDASNRLSVLQVGAAGGGTVLTGASNNQLVGANSNGVQTALMQADKSAAISIATNTITQIVALSGSTKIYVTSFDFLSAGTANFKFVYGTGSNCGTGTTDLTGLYNLTAQSGISKGGGLGPVLVVPAGNALCVSDSTTVQISGSVAYTQF